MGKRKSTEEKMREVSDENRQNKELEESQREQEEKDRDDERVNREFFSGVDDSDEDNGDDD